MRLEKKKISFLKLPNIIHKVGNIQMKQFFWQIGCMHKDLTNSVWT